MSSRCDDSEAVAKPDGDISDMDDSIKSIELWPCLNCAEQHIVAGAPKCTKAKVCINCSRGFGAIPDIAKGHDTMDPSCPNPEARAYHALCRDLRQSRAGWTAGYKQPDSNSIWESMNKTVGRPLKATGTDIPRHPPLNIDRLHPDEMPVGPWDEQVTTTPAEEALIERARRERAMTNQSILDGTARDAFEVMRSRSRASSRKTTRSNPSRSRSAASAKTSKQAQAPAETSDPVVSELPTTVPSEMTTPNTENTSTIPPNSTASMTAVVPGVSETPHSENTPIAGTDITTSFPLLERGRPNESPVRVSRSLSPLKRRAFGSPETERSPSKRAIKNFTSRVTAIDSSMRPQQVGAPGSADGSRQLFPTGSEVASSSQPQLQSRHVCPANVVDSENLEETIVQQDEERDEYPLSDEEAMISAK